MALKTAQLILYTTYNDEITTADDIAEALDILLTETLLTSDALNAHGNPEVGCIGVELDCFVD